MNKTIGNLVMFFCAVMGVFCLFILIDVLVFNVSSLLS